MDGSCYVRLLTAYAADRVLVPAGAATRAVQWLLQPPGLQGADCSREGGGAVRGRINAGRAYDGQTPWRLTNTNAVWCPATGVAAVLQGTVLGAAIFRIVMTNGCRTSFRRNARRTGRS